MREIAPLIRSARPVLCAGGRAEGDEPEQLRVLIRSAEPSLNAASRLLSYALYEGASLATYMSKGGPF